MDLSYSQNLEDYHLSLAFAEVGSGTYIDIGAGHPVADNVSFWFYERGWHGIVVEPQGDLIELYARLRPRDVAVQCLLGRECGEVDFHVVERLHGLSTAIESIARQARRFGVDYRTVRMPCTTLARLCDDHKLSDIDFLKIDVEGAEAEVLQGGDWRRYRPKVIVVEAVITDSAAQTWKEWEPFLLAQGYHFALDDTLNRFYVAHECPEVLSRLPTTRAPWDKVLHMYEIGRAPENPKHPDHALAQQLTRGFWASLPYLDRDLIAAMLDRARKVRGDKVPDVATDTEAFLGAIGRIACGYDGGQIVEE
jgi:FkbM family methyltransferase